MKIFTQWDNFNVDTIGSAPVGWTPRGGAVPAVLEYGTPSVNERQLNLTSTAGAIRCLSCDALDNVADRQNFDIVTAFTFTSSGASPLIFGRGQGGASITDAMFAFANYSAGYLQVLRISASTVTSINTQGYSFAINTPYFLRFRGSNSDFYVTIWPAENVEPTFQLYASDSTVSSAGWVGLGAFDGATNKNLSLNFFGFASGGDGISAPWTNQQWLDWADLPSAAKCVAGKMQYLGYDRNAVGKTKQYSVYVSNRGYQSNEADDPSNELFLPVIDSVPTFSSEISVALSGEVTINTGKLILNNPLPANRKTQAALELTTTHTASPSYTYMKIATSGYVMQAGDNLEYDLFPDAGSPNAGGIEVEFTTAPFSGRAIPWLDTGGVAGTLPNYVGGAWYSRKLPFHSSMIGKTINLIMLVAQSYSVQAHKCLYRNVRITNSSGVTQQIIWGGGNLQENALSYFLNSSKQAIKIVDAPVYPFNSQPGVAAPMLDKWLNMRWLRDGFELKLGDARQPYYNFRTFLRGRLGKPIAPTNGKIEFTIADLSDILRNPLVTQIYTSGEFVNQRKPLLIGAVANHIELTLIDKNNLVYNLTKGGFADPGLDYPSVLNNDIPITGTFQIASVDVATDVCTTGAPHGMTAGWMFITKNSTAGVPSGMSNFTRYWVLAAGLTGTTFKCSTTPAGTPVDITGAASSGAATWTSYGYFIDFANSLITLVNNPGTNARITIKDAIAPNGTTFNVADIYDKILFAEGGISRNYKGQSSFDILTADGAARSSFTGLYKDTQVHSILEWLTDLQNGEFTWLAISPDGLIEVGRLGLPASLPVAEFNESDFLSGSLHLIDRIRQVDFSAAQVTYKPAYLRGSIISSTNPQTTQGKAFLPPYNYGSVAAPLDNYPAISDADTSAKFAFSEQTVVAGLALRDHLVALFKLPLGVFEIKLRLRAARLKLGSTIRITSSRLGWRAWSAADPISPENSAAIDATLCVVIAKSVDLNSNDAFKVTLKVYRPLYGIYPEQKID